MACSQQVLLSVCIADTYPARFILLKGFFACYWPEQSFSVTVERLSHCPKRLVPELGRKTNMPRRLPEKTKNAPRKPRRFGSKSRFQSGRPLFQQSPVKENQELEVVIDDIGSRGDGIAKIQGFLIFVPSSKIGERVKVRIRSVSGKFAVAERVAQAQQS